MMKRRDLLKLAVSGLATPALSAFAGGGAVAQSPAADPRGARFDPADVLEMARKLAKQPFRKPAPDLPEPISSLNYEQYSAIRRKKEALIWGDHKVGFALEPTSRGFIFNNTLRIHVVEDGYARRLTYDPGDYTFGKSTQLTDKKDIGFAGFRMLRLREDGPPEEVLLFQGAGYYLTAARGQPFGAAARALAIRPVDPDKGEEFPYIAAVWIERPVLAANALVIHALLDSESLTGAYRFTLRPGDATIVDTECTLFTRVAVKHLGLAAMQGTYLFGPIDRRRSDDVRPNLYDVSGLQMLSGKGEWIWRPVSNRQSLQTSAFVDENPRGFGLLQRDRNFAHFEDDDNHWETRPSVWTEPIGDWGKGHVTLLEIPAESQVNQNILAYWRPGAGLPAQTENSFAYRQWWGWRPAEQPPFAIATRSRSGRTPGAAPNSFKRRFMVEFTGDILGDAAAAPEVVAKAWSPNGALSNVRVVLARDQKAARVTFDVDAAAEQSAELRLLLEAAGKQISETWLYRWTP